MAANIDGVGELSIAEKLNGNINDYFSILDLQIGPL